MPISSLPHRLTGDSSVKMYIKVWRAILEMDKNDPHPAAQKVGGDAGETGSIVE